MVTKTVLGLVVVATIISGGLAVDAAAAPAADAAACYGSVSLLKGKNNTCSSARHWNAIRNAKSKYGDWVGRSRWSSQRACWANVVSYGMTAR
ncbi:hypothetical protein [Curtobacterium sp. MCBD17_032]|uniref:hypothetical protein n=1 Tax=Curtobacterium sp. MCBD17_032 TaxID=2175659 RepID=UPI0011B5036E|nr:hypothetical protein [Curtobacterium sp. MCBD17_032]